MHGHVQVLTRGTWLFAELRYHIESWKERIFSSADLEITKR